MNIRPRILIVEDNSDLRRLYAIGLNRHGFEVKLAANGAEAIDRIEHECPDLILLDVLMPIMNGWEVLDRVHLADRHPPVPVVVVSGQSNPEEDRPHKVAAWLSKPVSIEELVTTISQQLALRVRDHSESPQTPSLTA